MPGVWRALWLMLSASIALPAWAAPPLIAVTQIVEHPSLDAARAGLLDGLAAHGLVQDRDFAYEFLSAQGSAVTAAQIAKAFVGKNPAVIVAISTPSAQAAASATRTIPIVFAAVTDPVSAGLVHVPPRPDTNITGVTDRAPVPAQFALMVEILPQLKHLGVIYNPGEANSASLVRELKTEGAKRDIAVYEASISRAADVPAAIRSLANRCEAYWIPTDNMVVSALEAALNAARNAHIPVFAADAESVARGAIASIGLDYRASGRKAAESVIAIMKGGKPADLPVGDTGGSELVINLKAAESFGLAIPDAVQKRASRIIAP